MHHSLQKKISDVYNRKYEIKNNPILFGSDV